MRVKCKLLLKIRLFSIQILRKYEQMEFSWMKNIFKSKKVAKISKIDSCYASKRKSKQFGTKNFFISLIWWFSGDFFYILIGKRRIRFITIFDWDNSIFIDENRQRKWFNFVYSFLPNISLTFIETQPDVSLHV